MTNEELKKKILSLVRGAMLEADELPFIEGTENIADALIAAGIGDVKSWEISDADKEQSSINYYCEMREWKDKCKEAERRAEVAGLIAKRACDIVFSQEIDSEEWDEAIFNYKKEKGIREIGITPNILYDYLKEQAEKELAEEKGNG